MAMAGIKKESTLNYLPWLKKIPSTEKMKKVYEFKIIDSSMNPQSSSFTSANRKVIVTSTGGDLDMLTQSQGTHKVPLDCLHMKGSLYPSPVLY